MREIRWARVEHRLDQRHRREDRVARTGNRLGLIVIGIHSIRSDRARIRIIAADHDRLLREKASTVDPIPVRRPVATNGNDDDGKITIEPATAAITGIVAVHRTAQVTVRPLVVEIGNAEVR